MAPRKKLKSAPPETVSTTVHDLPDSLLQHVLSFLPAQESVRTCVLARRWRHLWKSTTGLGILDLVLDDDEDISFQDLRKFVEHLLMLRERTDLESVEMKFHCYYEGESYVSLWTRFALICKVRVLTLHILGEEYFTLDGLPLVSRHLKTLDLYGLILQKSFLDFASCPALENLKMDVCKINGCKISSLFLKHLTITSCGCDLDCRLNVSTPGLVSFKLDRFSGKTCRCYRLHV